MALERREFLEISAATGPGLALPPDREAAVLAAWRVHAADWRSAPISRGRSR